MDIIKMKKEQIPYVLYFYLQSKIGECAFQDRGEGIMSIEQCKWKFFQWKIPEKLKPAIIKIWQDLGIVEKVDRRNIRFIKTDFDINDLRDVNKFLGII